MNKLPIGIQTFKDIRESNQIYIDKTKEAFNLIENYKYVFLSRPRRFGKSLFLDTLKNIFEGKKELFQGLYIYDKYDFTKYPVIKIDWAGNFKTLESTQKTAKKILEENQERLGIECKLDDDIAVCFRTLIQEAYKKYNQKVVILIDEYDKPILDNIENTERALENRDFLRGIYIQLKANDEYIKFAFLTGISKFSKASIFSGLNNLDDISLTPEFGNICGYTQENIKNEFYEYSKKFDLEKVRVWYNGYYFLKDRIYNPYDILKLFKYKEFSNYWWESGTPYSLIELFKKNNYYIPELENIKISNDILNTFEVDNIDLVSLLYQAGYLTIKNKEIDEFDDIIYTLKVPNKEVQKSLNSFLLREYLNINANKEAARALLKADLEKFEKELKVLFSSIAYNNYTKNNIEIYEGYYASIIYTYLASLGMELIPEDVTNKGRIDLTIKFKDKIYIIEFKVDSDDALKQIKEKKYYEKYLNENKDIYLIGINFKDRNISKLEWEKI